ncbi:hypothetical protein, partial [Vibrio penaeicida]|uniref:hypothetical protein n=1 Tax=Vibrio penaeicida TaxID=104609 RepID=UPI00163CE278
MRHPLTIFLSLSLTGCYTDGHCTLVPRTDNGKIEIVCSAIEDITQDTPTTSDENDTDPPKNDVPPTPEDSESTPPQPELVEPNPELEPEPEPDPEPEPEPEP